MSTSGEYKFWNFDTGHDHCFCVEIYILYYLIKILYSESDLENSEICFNQLTQWITATITFNGLDLKFLHMQVGLLRVSTKAMSFLLHFSWTNFMFECGARWKSVGIENFVWNAWQLRATDDWNHEGEKYIWIK